MARSTRAGVRWLVIVLPVVLLVTTLTTATARAAGNRVDLRILLVTDRSPELIAVQALLASGGVPFDLVDLTDPGRRRLSRDELTVPDTVPHARYQGVVLPNEAPAGLDRVELAALHDYELDFGIRQLDAAAHPTPRTGLAEPTDAVGWSGPFAGGSARLTDLARADGFGDMRGDIPFSPGAWAEIAAPLRDFRPVLTATSPDGRRRGVLAGVLGINGREELVLTFSYDAASTQFAALGPGIVEWLTRGVHLGLRRSYLAVHVDDVLLQNARWVPGAGCSSGHHCPLPPGHVPTIRMTADDVTHAVAWQERHRFRLDLAFNGAGSAAAGAADPLTAALLAHKDAFGWINHTWSHRYLGCVRDVSMTPWRCATVPVLGWTRYVSRSEIGDEIARNVGFARRHGLPVDPSELVTGEHSGLRGDDQMPHDSPHLAGALDGTGIAVVAADASLEREQRPVGGARTVPRHPIDLDFDTATVAETVDQYNWTHTSTADGGDGACEGDGSCLAPVDAADPAAGFADGIVPIEAAKILAHVLGNDPRPHYVHQPQLTEDRTIYPVLERVLDGYRALYTDDRPVLVPTMTQAADELTRTADWAADAGRVRAWVQDGVVTVVADGRVDVPLTVPANRTDFGEPYGTTRSAWVPVEGEQLLTGAVT